MWFALGLISLLAIAAISVHRRLHAAWPGTRAEAHSRQYLYRILRSDKGDADLYLGIEAPEGFDFKVRHERWYDRLAKAVGITVEQQTGDAEFDRALYLISDDLRVQRPLVDFSQLRADLIELSHPADGTHCRFDHLRCSDGRLWVRYGVPRDFPEAGVPALANDMVPRLARLSDKLGSAPTVQGPRWRDKFVRRAAVILGLGTALLLNGVLQLVRIGVSDAITIDEDELIVDALALTILAMPVLLTTTLFLLGRTARAHLALFEFALVGTCGLLLSSVALLRDMNMEFDDTAPVSYATRVVDKRIIETRRTTTYKLVVADWTGEGESRELDVRRETYERFATGNTVSMQQRNGYLGARWVDRLTLNGQADF